METGRWIEPDEVEMKRELLETMGTKVRSIRGAEWLAFAEKVLAHIENYTVPQYGDRPNDNVEMWGAKECANQVGKYANRFGKSSRPGEEQLDMLKAAHYAQLTFDKFEEGK